MEVVTDGRPLRGGRRSRAGRRRYLPVGGAGRRAPAPARAAPPGRLPGAPRIAGLPARGGACVADRVSGVVPSKYHHRLAVRTFGARSQLVRAQSCPSRETASPVSVLSAVLLMGPPRHPVSGSAVRAPGRSRRSSLKLHDDGGRPIGTSGEQVIACSDHRAAGLSWAKRVADKLNLGADVGIRRPSRHPKPSDRRFAPEWKTVIERDGLRPMAYVAATLGR